MKRRLLVIIPNAKSVESILTELLPKLRFDEDNEGKDFDFYYNDPNTNEFMHHLKHDDGQNIKLSLVLISFDIEARYFKRVQVHGFGRKRDQYITEIISVDMYLREKEFRLNTNHLSDKEKANSEINFIKSIFEKEGWSIV